MRPPTSWSAPPTPRRKNSARAATNRKKPNWRWRSARAAPARGAATAAAWLRGRAAGELERRQKSRATRTGRDALDRALIDLAGCYRDALLVSAGAGGVRANHPDMADRVAALAAHAPPERLLRCIEAVLACREALAINVKPKFAVDAMVATIGQELAVSRAAPAVDSCRRGARVPTA